MKLILFVLMSLFYVAGLCAQNSLLWKFSTGTAIYGSPVISKNSIFFGSSDMNLYAVDKSSGQLIWKFKTGGQVNSTPCVFQNKIIFSNTDGNVYSLDKNTGKQLWKFATKGEYRYDPWDYYLSSPVADDGIVYVGSGDSTVYAIDPESGKNIWSFKTNGIVHATPVVKDKVLYIGSFDGFLYALNSKNGEVIWKFKTVGDANFPKGEIQKAVAVYDNSIIFGSRDYNIYALDSKTGTGRWNMKDRGGWIIATPFIYKDNIYFGSSDSHTFYCMGANSGEIKWTLPLNMRVYGTASILDGKIVFGCFNGKLYVVNPETGHPEFIFQTEESKTRYYSIYNKEDEFRIDFKLYDNIPKSEKQILSLGSVLSDPLVEGHTVFFGDSNGYFYALSLK